MNHAGSSEVRTNRQMHRNIREDRIYIDGNTARKLQSAPANGNRMQRDQIKRQKVKRQHSVSPMNLGYIFFYDACYACCLCCTNRICGTSGRYYKSH